MFSSYNSHCNKGMTDLLHIICQPFHLTKSIKNFGRLLELIEPKKLDIDIKLGIVSAGIFSSPAFIRTIFYFTPILFPLLSPGKWSSTNTTYFLRQIRFLNPFHVS